MSAFFIRRPIVAIVIAVVTVIGGVISLRGLPVAQFPDIVPPQIMLDIGTSPNIDQVNVQNRFAQAQPNLPTEVAQYGFTMRKSTGLPMVLASFYSPNRSYDSLF